MKNLDYTLLCVLVLLFVRNGQVEPIRVGWQNSVLKNMKVVFGYVVIIRNI